MKHLKKTCAALCILCCATSFVLAEGAPKNAQNEKRIQSLFKRLDISISPSLRVPFENPEDTTIGLGCGIRASFLDGDLRFYEVIPSTVFFDAGGFSGFIKKNANEPQYGASFAFSRFVKFPLTVKAGMLSLGGTFSRLRSPALSFSSTPFSKSLSTKTGISVSLPSSGTSKKEFSISLDVRVPKTWRTFAGSGGTFFYRRDGTFAASADFLINLPRMIKTGLSFTGTRFYLENKSKAWFSPQGFFKPDWFGAFSLQAFFSSPIFTTLFTCNAYMQPTFPLRYTFKSENRLTINKFNMLVSAFAIDARGFASSERGIVLDGGSVLTTLAQVKATPQYTWRFASSRLPSLTVGAGVAMQYKDKNAERYGEAKYSVGAQYADRFMSMRLSFAADGFRFTDDGADTEKRSYTISAKFSRAKGNVKPSAQASYKFGNGETSETCNFSLSTKGKKSTVSSNTGVTFKQKNGEFSSGTVSLGFSASYITKFIKYSFKLNATGKW